MTYGDLKGWLETLTPRQLATTVTVYDTYDDEYTAVVDAYEEEDSDVLDCEDVAHPVLELKA